MRKPPKVGLWGFKDFDLRVSSGPEDAQRLQTMRKGRPVLPRGNSGAGLRTGCLVTVVSFSFVSSAVSFQNGTGRRFCAQISALIAGSALPGGISDQARPGWSKMWHIMQHVEMFSLPKPGVSRAKPFF